jgi:hypothetical protein
VAFLGVYILAGLIRRQLGVIDYRFFYHFFVFASGFLIARTGTLERAISPRFYLLDKIGFATLGVTLFALNDQSIGSLDPFLLFSFPVFAVSLTLLVLSLAKLLVQANFALPFFSYVAFAAYFAYLLHRPIWKAMWALYQPENVRLGFLYINGLGSIFVVLVSYALQKAYNGVVVSLSERFEGEQDDRSKYPFD